MAQYLVELHGECREVYVVDADSPADAEARWAEDGHLQVQESSSMEVYGVRKDDD